MEKRPVQYLNACSIISYLIAGIIGTTLLASCGGSDNEQIDPDLVNKNAIMHRCGLINPLFKNDKLKEFLSKKYTAKKKNDVIFIMIDSLRRDYITKESAPNLYAFLEEQKELKGISSSTITHHSSFSIFYGLSAYLRDFVLKNEWDMGSPFLNILKNIGYRISLYGSPWQYCLDDDKFYNSRKELSEYSESNLQILYGKKTKNLADFCYVRGQGPGAPQLNPKVEITAKDEQGRTYGHQAYMDYEVVNDFLKDIKNHNDKNFYLLYLFSAHIPYAWPDRGTLMKEGGLTYLKNSVPWAPGEAGFKGKNPTEIINSYKNSIKWVDYLFKKTIDGLKSEGKYDNSLIVFFSDHGEFLFDTSTPYEESSNRVGHCCTPYPENMSVPLAYKFPKNSVVDIKRGSSNIGSQLDIVPTVLDYLGFDGFSDYKQFINGRSILSKERNCAVTFSPAGRFGPRVFTVTMPNDIIYLQLNDPSTLKSDGFFFNEELKGKDLIKVDKNDAKSQARFDALMRDQNFMECLHEVFGKCASFY